VLFTDLTNDGWPDLLIGNDFGPADVGYENDGNGNLIPNASLIPMSAATTMSFTSGDFDGDLTNELYIGQISRTDDRPAWAAPIPRVDRCDASLTFSAPGRCEATLETLTRIDQVSVDRSLSSCLRLVGIELESCLIGGIGMMSNRGLAGEPCESIDRLYPEFSASCRRLDSTTSGQRPSASAEGTGEFPSVRDRNLLIDFGPEGGVDLARERGLDFADWTWDSSPIDVENDGDLDIAVVNGMIDQNSITTNVVFLNEPAGFVASTYDIGFGDHAPTTGSVIFDVDNDGDADLLTVPVDGPVNLYRNTGPTGSSIEFEFLLETPTAGTMVIVTAGEDTYRHGIVMGGGYTSFDSSRILAGLGDYDGPVEVDITWPDGRRTRLEGLLPGNRYRISQ